MQKKNTLLYGKVFLRLCLLNLQNQTALLLEALLEELLVKEPLGTSARIEPSAEGREGWI